MARRKDDPTQSPEYVYELARRRVRVLLAENGLTVEDMAVAIGMTRASLYDRLRVDWTSSKGSPQPRFQLHEIKAISARYGIPEADFFNPTQVRVIRDDDGPSRSSRSNIRYSGESVIDSGNPQPMRTDVTSGTPARSSIRTRRPRLAGADVVGVSA